MPNTALSLNQLILSAQDLHEMTDWPDALIEDYLNILRGLILVADTIDNVAGGNSESTLELRAIINNAISSLNSRIDATNSISYNNKSVSGILSNRLNDAESCIESLKAENSTLKSIISQFKVNQDRLEQRVNNLETLP